MAKLLFQGHGSFRITSENGNVLYVDPYAGNGYDKPADLVLTTHQHPDHISLHLVPQKNTCKVLQSFDMLKNGVYATETHLSFTVKAVPAYNDKHSSESCVGYMIDVDGVRIYASGDTSYIPEMNQFRKEFHPNYCLLPIDGVFNMGPEEAAHCAEIIGAQYAIPIHMVPGGKKLFSEEMAARFTPKNRCIVQVGEEITL